MDQLLQELVFFNADSKKEELEEWAQLAEGEIDKMNEKEGSFYYLVLAEFYAIYLRDVETGYEMLKRVDAKMAVTKDQVRVRRCFFKYLEGAYEFALEELEGIAGDTAALSSRRIAVDFFRRAFDRDKTSGQSKLKSKLRKKQSYEQDFLKALRAERGGYFKLAREMHTAIYTKYGGLDETILYESAKSVIRLIEKEKIRVDREQIQEYIEAIQNFEKKIQNKRYYQSKMDFIFRVLDFIEFEEQGEDLLIDYKLAKSFIVQHLEKAIAKTHDADALLSLKRTLEALKADEEAGQEICYKFLGDKAYSKLLLSSNPNTGKSQFKGGQSILKKPKKEEQANIQYEQEQEVIPAEQSKLLKPKVKLKQTTSKMVQKEMQKEINPEFKGSNMVKINYNSGGYEQRLFYINEDFKSTLKIFYCDKKSRPSKDDDFYSLKYLKSMTLGKESDALKRAECEQFPEENCLTLKIKSEDVYERNFYVKNKEDYDCWVAIFQDVLASKQTSSRLKKTKVVVS